MKANVIDTAGFFLLSLWAIRSPAQVISLSQIKNVAGPDCFVSSEAITWTGSETSRLLVESRIVRAANLIPANRTVRPLTVEKIQALLNQAQAYYLQGTDGNERFRGKNVPLLKRPRRGETRCPPDQQPQ